VSADVALVAIDLDGTLLSSSGEIPEANRRAVSKCLELGVAVAIATGRRFPAAERFARALSGDIFVVANSGAIIKDSVDGSIIRRRLLPRRTAAAVIEIADTFGIEPVVHDGPQAEGNLLLRETAIGLPHLERYLHRTHPPPSVVPALRLARDPVQIGFAAGVTTSRAFVEALGPELDRRGMAASLMRTEYPREDLTLTDVLATAATKSSALTFLADHLGVPITQTLAIGDNWNDVDMLETAGRGVLMANASEELQARGFTPTESNDDDGVARALERHVLSGSRLRARTKK